MVIQYLGKVTEDGKLKIWHKSRFYEDLKLLAGKQIEITIHKKRKKRSTSQLGYWHAVVVAMVHERFKELGNHYSKQQIHEYLKSNFLFEEIVNKKTGDITKMPLSLGEDGNVSTTQMMEAIEEIQQWAVEDLEIIIPNPGQQSLAIDGATQ